MTHTSPAKSYRLKWKRHVKNWQLCLSGKVQAFGERDFGHWLCYTREDTGDDGLIGRFRTLAAAKVYVERHVSFSISTNHSPAVCSFPEIAPL